MTHQNDPSARTARTASSPASSPGRPGFTITELLVVVGLVTLLAGLLFVALNAATASGKMADSMNRMRQISTWMTVYATDHRETILPSRFDYSFMQYKGKVRSISPNTGDENVGTWSDILWTLHMGDTIRGINNSPYAFDSPDVQFYTDFPEFDDNPFRSAALNSRNSFVDGDGIPLPFGDGAQEVGEPGYFAANDAFDATGGNWTSTGQIKAPERTMYLVDSFAGEVIAPEPGPFDTDLTIGTPTLEVDFRYNESCLMLFLDGHITPEDDWQTLQILQEDRGIIVQP